MSIRERAVTQHPVVNQASTESERTLEAFSTRWYPPELHEILANLLEQLHHSVDCDACALWLLAEDSLYLAASWGWPIPTETGQRQFKLSEQSWLNRLIHEGQPARVAPGLPETMVQGSASVLGTGAAIVAPLVHQRRPIGLLLAIRQTLQLYTEREVQLATAVADQAATAIENVRLYAQTRQLALHLEMASQVSQKIASILDTDELLTQVVQLIQATFHYYQVHLFLVDKRTDEIVLKKSSGRANERLQHQELRLKIGKEGITGWVAAAGQALVCNDVSREARYHPHELLPETRAEMAVPLLIGEVVMGVLDVQSERPNAFHDDDLKALQVLADQAAQAIENARLYADTRRQALQLEAVSQVSQTATSILEMDQLLVEVVRLIREKLGYYHVNLFLVEGSTQEVVLREASGQADESLKRLGLRLKVGKEGITGWVAAAGKPLLCNDVSQEPRYHPHELLPGTQAELAVPLRLGDVVVGVLDVQSERRGAFHPDDVRALQILADQVAISIENAHLFDRAQGQIEAMRALHDISLDITSHLDVQEVLNAILKQATHFLKAQGSSLAIVDRQAGTIRLAAVHNVPSEFLGATLQLGEGVTGRVVASGKPIIVNDLGKGTARNPIFRNSPYDAIISVPLRREGEVFGTLNVVDQGERRPFLEEDVHLLSLFADMACIALKNAELYGQVRQAGEELEQKVEQRTRELAQAQEALADKANELRRLLALTVHVQEQERTRIARDLHDGSNQLITGTLYELQAAQESIAGHRPEVALQKLEIAKGLLRSIEAENRRIISGLRPSILDSQGLVSTLKWHASSFQKLYGIACLVRISGQPGRLPPDTEIAIYRIVQEALNNVTAHAQAHNVEIHVHCNSSQWRIIVHDDGIGFDHQNALTATDTQMGLIGMRERAQSIGGHIEVLSAPGQGTRLELDVPLPTDPLSIA